MNDFWQKQQNPLFPDLTWNKPEQKSQSGLLAVIGGNSQSFKIIADIANAAQSLGIGKTTIYVPASLKSKIPTTPDIFFEPATESGSFNRESLRDLTVAVNLANLTLIPGDLSKNSETSSVIAELVTTTEQPLLVTRDAFDAILPNSQNFIERPNLSLLISMSQLQALFKAIYYPRPLLLSQPLLPALDTLHKFTTTYTNLTIITLHQDQIIVAHNGRVTTTDIKDTLYSPISIWDGRLATTIAAYAMWNPSKPLEAATTAIILNNPKGNPHES